MIGTYGLRLIGLPAAAAVLHRAEPTWPALVVERRPGTGDRVQTAWDGERALLNVQGGGHASVTRRPLVASFSLPHRPGDAEMVHPYLAATSAIVSRWLGRESFHGGAFARDGQAWVVVGDKGAGKSSALGWLATNGHQVLTDDLVVLDGPSVLAGPRCLDLRPDAAAHLGVGEDLGVVGARERWRLALPAGPLRLPLAGWVLPRWGEVTEVARVPPLARLGQLMPHLTLRRPLDAARLLELASLPCMRFTRARAWEALPSAMGALLAVLDTTSGPVVSSPEQ